MPGEQWENDPAGAASDPQRLADVRASGLLDTPADPRFDRWTAFVRKALDCDVSLITLLDRDRQFFKSASGLAEPWASRRETPLSHSFCQHVVARGAMVRVVDARSDPAVSGNAAIADLGVIAYLGVPLRSGSGRLLGSISAIRKDPHEWTDTDAGLLADAAAAVEAEIEFGTVQGRMQAVMTNLTDVIMIFAGEGRILYVSPSLGRILGRRAEDHLGGHIGNLVHPDDRADLDGARARVLERPGSTSSVTVRMFHADGSQRFMEARLTNLLDNPAVEGILAVLRDVTEREEAEERLQLFLAHAPVAFWIVDRELRFVWAAGLAMDGLNMDPDLLLDATAYDMFGSDDADSAEIAAYHRALQGHHERFDVAWSGRWWEVRLAPMPDVGNGRGVLGVALDVTDRKAVAMRLEERTAHFQGLFEEAPEAIILVDGEDRILQVNPEFERVFGYSLEEALGRQINDLIVDPGLADEAAQISRRVAGGERLEVETVRRRKDGSTVEVSILATPVNLRGGERHIYGIYRDISERKELEARLLHSQRLEAVGQLAGGVAHDFNNILTAILGHVTVLLERYGGADPELVEELEEIRAASDRAARLTRQLLTFSRRDIVVPRPTDVSEVIRKTGKLLQRVIPETIDLSFDLATTLPAVDIDPGQLEQVVMNLVINARDAMRSGGRLKVRTGPAPSVPAGPESAGDRPWVLIEVTDEGVGMSPDEVARMFEPFFTTKEAGVGTGLGLSTVHGIVSRAGGRVEVGTEPGVGTSIGIRLPPSESPPAEPRPAPPAVEDAVPGHGRTVLLVDDDRAVRQVLSRILKRADYRVVEAESGEAALARLQELEIRPDAVVSDLVMPGMSGDELLRRLRASVPEISCVLMTGYADPDLDYEIEAETLLKPFDAPTLLSILSSRLAE